MKLAGRPDCVGFVEAWKSGRHWTALHMSELIWFTFLKRPLCSSVENGL